MKQHLLMCVQRLGLVVLLMLAACSDDPGSPETQLRAWLLQMETAVEEKSLSDIKPLISPDYQDAKGNTRQRIMLQLALLFKQHDSIQLDNTITELTAEPTFARMVLTTRFSRSVALARLGLTDNAYQFVLFFEPDGKQWQVSSVSYSQLSP